MKTLSLVPELAPKYTSEDMPRMPGLADLEEGQEPRSRHAKQALKGLLTQVKLQAAAWRLESAPEASLLSLLRAF